MIPETEKFNKVIEKIDELNARDPHQEGVEGVQRSRELLYSKRLTEWVLKLEPEPSETLRIAARGQHICRWTVPRDRYPMTRGGYLRWREDLKKFHAGKVGEIMREAGYPEHTIEKVSSIIQKKNLNEPETQTVEDALCLEFLCTQFSDLKSKTPPDKMKEIVLKTWKKMSPKAQETALGLDLKAEEKQFLQQVLKRE